MNRLLINADDFGLHPLINDAVQHCVESGVVNSISVMANAEFVEYSLLKKFQQKGSFVGVHLSWVRSKWLTADYEIFSWREFVWNLLTGGKIFRDSLKKEAEAQIELMIENGIFPDHLDSHQHVHHLSPVWQITEELCKQYRIKRIRCCMVKDKSLRRIGLAGIALQRLAVSRFDPEYHFLTAGIKFTGNYSLKKLTDELVISSGVDTELIVHPGLDTNSLDKLYPDWHFDWEKEYAALMDGRFSEAISGNGFSLSKRTTTTV